MVLKTEVYQKDGSGVYWTLGQCRGSSPAGTNLLVKGERRLNTQAPPLSSGSSALENRSDKCYKVSFT
jgi:hypothetical protein